MHSAPISSNDGTPQSDDETPDLALLRLRLAWVLAGVLVILLLIFIPPLISVSRFQRRIASNLSTALGRPVHLDRVTLSLLPLPGFRLENFVVDEDPAFGYEPILRANEVRATVRLSSLWSHHAEFSRISLAEPTSLNLVRLPDGRWNFEPVLLQASRIEAAPTSQTFAGPAPRFPYIEATGARINLKLGNEKTPIALTDSDFALWLPGPRQWRFRLDAHPARTDTASSDAGLLRLQGTLGDGITRAATLGEVPIDLRASWDAAPLAGIGRIVLGRDAGLRGDMTLNLHGVGSVAHAALSATLGLARLRRSDFIPGRLIDLQASCQATSDGQFHSFSNIECHSPEPAVLIATGSIPDVGDLRSASGQLTVPSLPAATALAWIAAATRNTPALSGPGVLAGSLAWNLPERPGLSGGVDLSGEWLALPGKRAPVTIPLGQVLLRSETPAAAPTAAPAPTPARHPAPYAAVSVPAGWGFELLPIPLALGGRQPASLEGRFDDKGYTLRLTGPATLSRALALADSVPQLGDGLRECLGSPPQPSPDTGPAASAATSGGASESPTPDPSVPLHLDLTATRAWGSAPVWTGCPAAHP